MSLWNWKKSGWVSISLAFLLILAVITSVCSTGIRTAFKELALNLRFHNEFHPEAGIFNFLLSCSAMLGFICVALRYSFIKDQVQVMPTSLDYLNKLSIFTGIISFFGLILIASFSVTLIDMVSSFQSAGAYIFIGLGLIFTVLQTVLTYTSSRISLIFFLRTFLSVILMCTFISSIVFIEKSKEDISLFNETHFLIDNSAVPLVQHNITSIIVQKEMMLLSAYVLERVSVVVYALFFLTFFTEFQTISTYIIMRPFISNRSSDFRSSSLTVNERI